MIKPGGKSTTWVYNILGFFWRKQKVQRKASKLKTTKESLCKYFKTIRHKGDMK